MGRYTLKREGEVASRGKEEEEDLPSLAEEMKSILGEAMREAWRRPEARVMKRKLSEVGRKWWKPEIEEALKVTGYSKELQARAREVEYDKKVKEVWK